MTEIKILKICIQECYLCLLAVVDLLLPEHGNQSPFQCLSLEKHQCLWCEALWMSNTPSLLSHWSRWQVELDTRRLESSFWQQFTTVCWPTLTSALQQGFGLQVHLCDVSFGGVGRAQGACVGVVRQGLGGGVCGNVQSLRAGRHFLSLNWKTCTINTSFCVKYHYLLHNYHFNFRFSCALVFTYEGHILLIVSTAHYPRKVAEHLMVIDYLKQ